MIFDYCSSIVSPTPQPNLRVQRRRQLVAARGRSQSAPFLGVTRVSGRNEVSPLSQEGQISQVVVNPGPAEKFEVHQ
jgi:hypothetical protein